ncbi:MAG: DNA-3-methyladenine glycosylase I [Rhodospirillales bacterium]|nr:DNA-3-methyladenine glycosylase I [Rhodospirillales bacterium]
MERERLILGRDGQPRCWWCGDDPLYVAYHDSEWGRLQTDDIRLFEKLCLEGFQAGLSWITILRKRENFRAAFDGFDFRKIAAYDDSDVARLLQNDGIVRHGQKIRSVINNAQKMVDLIKEYGSLYAYLKPYAAGDVSPSLRATSPESIALSKDLKKRGFSFVGPTTAYAFLQAMGMVNDHVEGCFIRNACKI